MQKVFTVLFVLGLTGAGETPDSKISISEAGEPGTAMVVDVQVFGADGKTPAVGLSVQVFHTDNEGYYSPGGRNESKRRLKGFMTTDETGRFRFTSIRPMPYPMGGVPAHVHVILSPSGASHQSLELHFSGDEALTANQLKRDGARGVFAHIQPLVADKHGVLHGSWKLKLN